MVRVGGRSRGCAICRQKRIKCGEEVPSCSQCLRSGRSCPGALQGSIFLNLGLDSEVNEKHRGVANNVLPSPNTEARVISVEPENRLLSLSKPPYPTAKIKPHQRRISLCLSSFASASFYDKHFQQLLCSQPSYILLDRQRISGRFIECLTKSPGAPMLKAWMPQLPNILRHKSASTLKFALRAVSLALFGSLAHNKAAQIDGRRWYEKGLQSQRMDLKLIPEGNSPQNISNEAICGPMLLAFYEMTTCSTNSEAWIEHIWAASKLLEMKGVEASASGFTHDLFVALRLAMVYVTSGLRRPSFFATDIWLRIPFCERSKSMFDLLIDILTVIPLSLSRVDNVVTLGEKAAGATLSAVYAELQGIRRKLEEWWTHYTSDMVRHESPKNHPCGLNAVDTDSTKDSWLHNDPFKAEIVALYHSGSMLIIQSQMTICLPPLLNGFREEIVAHGASILQAVRYIEQAEVWKDAGGPFRLVFPLKVVRDTSPCQEQIQEAVKLLIRWRTERGINTICTGTKS